MSDEQEIIGTWKVTVKQWTWEYTFLDAGTVRWCDAKSREAGSGRWAKMGAAIHVTWTGSTTKESWACPITPDNQKIWYHSSYYTGWVTARSKNFEPGALEFNCDVGPVPVFTQGEAALCWAAGAAMMITWRRRNHGMSISQVMDTMGEPFITLYKEQKGLRLEYYKPWFSKAFDDYREATLFDMQYHYASAAGLKYEPLRSYTSWQLYELMARHRSPLLIIVNWNTEWTHAYVIKRMYTDGPYFEGGPVTTLIVYNDPTVHVGQDKIRFDDLAQKMGAAAGQVAIQVMHY
ncbi:MAG TPA: papain-like cysteine protease family protein [Xanthobacteraceae bacterium]|nr:papain-like cysteine protease family protein [Xanthobacteraceae bacterium]